MATGIANFFLLPVLVFVFNNCFYLYGSKDDCDVQCIYIIAWKLLWVLVFINQFQQQRKALNTGHPCAAPCAGAGDSTAGSEVVAEVSAGRPRCSPRQKIKISKPCGLYQWVVPVYIVEGMGSVTNSVHRCFIFLQRKKKRKRRDCSWIKRGSFLAVPFFMTHSFSSIRCYSRNI